MDGRREGRRRSARATSSAAPAREQVSSPPVPRTAGRAAKRKRTRASGGEAEAGSPAAPDGQDRGTHEHEVLADTDGWTPPGVLTRSMRRRWLGVRSAGA
eukprot:CAMPEP_0196774092 /NCGR_PEP_ID=MMETSP1104-20130614/3171_1 /TAXON_ID=33652 /ORGANISM="Cafeteria sp., Strain Caron Lab Isolate" /LENGTH=99 /DNA_ID=CAMNT_0042144245 /DNA_START=84 /DNA_END=379 /DNA_ORIENTATION=-